jgi:hypothetical protein
VLRADYPLEGHLTIKNTGSSSRCQCRVEIQGLMAECYRVEPVPLLYSGAQEDVRILIFHRLHAPEAGMHDILVTVTAPDSYPDEEMVLRQGLYVEPVFRQELVIEDDLRPARKAEPQREQVPPVVEEPLPVQEPVRRPTVQPVPRMVTAPLIEAPEEQPVLTSPVVRDLGPVEPSVFPPPDEAPAAVERQPRPARTAPVQNLANMKVVRDHSEDFWEEG